MKILLLIGLFAILLVVGCGTARRSAEFVGSPPPADETLLAGQAHFERFCNPCHPAGTAGLGPALNNKPLPRWAIRLQIRNGFGAMPSFPDEVISDEQVAEIIDYLKWLRRQPKGDLVARR